MPFKKQRNIKGCHWRYRGKRETDSPTQDHPIRYASVTGNNTETAARLSMSQAAFTRFPCLLSLSLVPQNDQGKIFMWAGGGYARRGSHGLFSLLHELQKDNRTPSMYLEKKS